MCRGSSLQAPPRPPELAPPTANETKDSPSANRFNVALQNLEAFLYASKNSSNCTPGSDGRRLAASREGTGPPGTLFMPGGRRTVPPSILPGPLTMASPCPACALAKARSNTYRSTPLFSGSVEFWDRPKSMSTCKAEGQPLGGRAGFPGAGHPSCNGPEGAEGGGGPPPPPLSDPPHTCLPAHATTPIPSNQSTTHQFVGASTKEDVARGEVAVHDSRVMQLGNHASRCRQQLGPSCRVGVCVRFFLEIRGERARRVCGDVCRGWGFAMDRERGKPPGQMPACACMMEAGRLAEPMH